MPTHRPTAVDSGTWVLGDLQVHRLGFGAMRLSAAAAFSGTGSRNRDRSVEALCRAVALGVTHLDTAAFYFSPRLSANEMINSALAPYPDELVIATKVGPSRDPSGEWWPRATAAELRGHVEENLRQLGREWLDLVYLRVQGPESVADRMAVLADLRAEGLIRHLGVSGVSPAQLHEALAITPLVAVQNRLSPERRSAATTEVMGICARESLAFVPFFTIAGNGAEGGAVAEVDVRIAALATKYDVSSATIRLAWTLHLGPNVLAIPGSGDPTHVEENVAAGSLRLTADDLAGLDGMARATEAGPTTIS